MARSAYVIPSILKEFRQLEVQVLN